MKCARLSSGSTASVVAAALTGAVVLGSVTLGAVGIRVHGHEPVRPVPTTGVPWKPLPALSPAAAAVDLDCASADLKFSVDPSGADHGQSVQPIRITNTSTAPCRILPATMTIAATLPDGAAAAIPSVTTASDPAQLLPGESARLLIQSPMQCLKAAPPASQLAGRAVLHFGQRGFTLVGLRIPITSCGAVSTDVEPPVPTDATDPYAGLTVTTDFPSRVTAGEHVTFTATLTNPNTGEISLDPCPSYTTGLFDGDPSTSAESTYQLNCSQAAGAIPAGGSIEFAMNLDVPTNAPSGVAKFGWYLEDSAAGMGSVVTVG